MGANRARMYWHTRRLYALEHAHMMQFPEMSFLEAKDKLNEVWKRWAPNNWKKFPPKLEYGEGLAIFEGKYIKHMYSFTEGRARIVLAPNARDLPTLLHETTHALRNGDTTHGPRFVGRMFQLLIDEQVTTLEELALAATRHRLDPRWVNYLGEPRCVVASCA